MAVQRLQRNLRALAEDTFDVVVIGGGVTGLSIARDAALRGLSVALIESDDFGAVTSGHWHRIIHGGMRYVQRMDLRRLRSAVHERAVWMHIAPHLVHPCGFLVLAHGAGVMSLPALAIGTGLYDMFTPERRRVADPSKRIPGRSVLSRAAVLGGEPVVNPRGLAGAALFYDGRVAHSGQLLVALALSAAEHGAQLANHAEVHGFLKRNGRIEGVRARCLLEGDEFDVRGRVVVNAAGPWVEGLDATAGDAAVPRSSWILNAVVATRSVTRQYGLGVPGFVRDEAGGTCPGKRLFFLMPWRNLTLVGTEELRFGGDPGRQAFGAHEIEGFLAEVNAALPAAELGAGDVRFVLRGVLPGKAAPGRATGLRLSDRARIVVHDDASGKRGLVSVVSIKFTEARLLAEHVVDRLGPLLDAQVPRSVAADVPVTGGDIGDWEAFRADELSRRPDMLDEESAAELISTYGTRWTYLASLVEHEPDLALRIVVDRPMVMAQVEVAVEDEMARTLEDVVFRRTEIGLLGDPGEDALRRCARRMGEMLGWSPARVEIEIRQVRAMFP